MVKNLIHDTDVLNDIIVTELISKAPQLLLEIPADATEVAEGVLLVRSILFPVETW